VYRRQSGYHFRIMIKKHTLMFYFNSFVNNLFVFDRYITQVIAFFTYF